MLPHSQNFKECQEVSTDWTAFGEGGMCKSLRAGHGGTGRLTERLSLTVIIPLLHNKLPQTWKPETPVYSQLCKSQFQALA